MVNDLLSVTHLPDKTAKPHLAKVNLQKTIQEIMETYTAYAHAQNIKLLLTVDKNKNYSIQADPEYIKIIIRNLLENAIRYSFSKETVELNLKKQNSEIIFACKNRGIGIPPNKQKFIFAKFFRAPNAIKKEGNGTGLGLYITREMVNLNHGQIWFESQPNENTIFYVKFKAC